MLTQQEIIDALHWETAFDTVNPTPETPFQITFQYATSQPADMSTQYTGWEAWTAAEKATYRAALDHIETLINVEFVEVTGQADPMMDVGKVDLANNVGGWGGFRYSYFGNELRSLDNFTLFNNDINMANALNLILHEVGHALMNKHPFDGDATLPDAFDNNKYTVMSYDWNPDNNQDSDAMMLFDVLALQDRWGANTTTASGNTTYTGSRTSNLDTIWDTGGTDTFDASAQNTDVILSLIEGTFSQFSGYDDVSIAYGVKIENAKGGSGNDQITGNEYSNQVYGGAGEDQIFGGTSKDFLYGNDDNDSLFGGKGNDVLRSGNDKDKILAGNGNDTSYGGKGADTMFGGSGKDTLLGGNGTDLIYGGENDDIVYAGSGQDTANGGLGDDQMYGGKGADKIYGNDGSDVLFGGDGTDQLFGGTGQDTLDGKSGNDTLKGGGDADVFVFKGGNGSDEILDFEDNIDTLKFTNLTGISDINDLLANATNTNGDVIIDLGADGSLKINDITLSALQNDIEFA